ncbi:S-layer homology domain-containing protein [Caldicellulosiruptor acetigenus]|uniref:S-layer domain-containing protein n=1 Tax=Caldicellulosiruptor acetigenus 6A TaxID=632516 RepID=G2PY36_9FIRM|nr:S-layer homology domain-containing protein [Caldicellulosiruptor acetigenus]AEM74903.1 S-layer domain-containing protein [Caldicellulosiruptor acetigenus 6A]
MYTKLLRLIIITFLVFSLCFILSWTDKYSFTSNVCFAAQDDFDMQWLAPGLRVWYLGIKVDKSNNESGSSFFPTETVYTITECTEQAIKVNINTSTNNYENQVSNYNQQIQRPASEGPFWISAKKLFGLKAGDILTVGDDHLQVSERKNMSYEELISFFGVIEADNLALKAIFASNIVGAKPDDIIKLRTDVQRDVVVLKGMPFNQEGLFTFVYDVRTGLLLGFKVQDSYENETIRGVSWLAEINYDFVQKLIFAEDDGPHAGYKTDVIYDGSLQGDWSKGMQLTITTIGRFGKIIQYNMVGSYRNRYGAGTTKIIQIINDLESKKVFASIKYNKEGVYNFGLSESRTYDLGMYTPFYIQKSDLKIDSLKIWNNELKKVSERIYKLNQSIDPVFQQFAFTYVEYDSEGYFNKWIIFTDLFEEEILFDAGEKGSFYTARKYYQQILGKPPAAMSESSIKYQIFKDINNHWAKDAIIKLVQEGVINGYPDNTFRPENTITRAEIAVILKKALKLPNRSGKIQNFIDKTVIPQWAKESLETCVAYELINGYTINGNFVLRPEKKITRAEIAVILSRALDIKKIDVKGTDINFKDKIPSWAHHAIEKTTGAGIIAGYPDGTFRPDKPVTRAEAAKMILKLLEKIGEI